MFSLNILEVVIGLAFIYLILSLITTTLTELIAQMLSMRSSNLSLSIQTLLNDMDSTGLARKFYEHPLIKSLAQKGYFLGNPRRPSYMNPSTFSLTLLDLIINPGKLNTNEFKSLTDAQQILAALRNSSVLNDNPELQRQLQVILDGAKTIDDIHKAVEGWFNDMMERASGWYKRKAQLVTLLVSILVTVLFNGDTLALFNRLTNDPAVRGALVGAAQNAIQNDLVVTPVPEGTPEPGGVTPPTSTLPDLQGAYTKINNLQQQINATFQIVGWSFPPVEPVPPSLTGLDTDARKAAEDSYNAAVTQYQIDLAAYTSSPLHLPQTSPEWIAKIIGLVLTAIAVSLGAPFWFDVLKRITNLRGSVKPPDPVPPEPPKSPDTAMSTVVDSVIVSPDSQGVVNISAPPADDGGVG